MTAEEIRAKYHAKQPERPSLSVFDNEIIIVAEIAAQLAELNAHLRSQLPDAHLPQECREHKCSYYKNYLAYGPADLTHEGFHAAEENAEAHFDNCSWSATDKGCPACTRHEQLVRA